VINNAIWLRQRPSFGERLSDVQFWINDCLQNHVLCKTSINIWPRRLVEVGSADGSTLPTLVYTDMLDKSQLQYTTLSHCWGQASNKHRTSTTSYTEHIYLEGIPVDELPLTYHHAIIITRYFNIRYIWIDSLCIVQDDTEDWEEEASKMADIFQGSYLTIAAASSSDSYGGCIFDVRSSDKSEPNVSLFPNFTVGSISKGSLAIMARTLADPRSIQSGPLYQRGWVLQETVLSPRTVLFDQDQMYWQCRTRITSEDGIINDDSVHGDVQRIFGWTPHEFDSLERKLTFWWRCVESYSSRHLTYAKDKTAAIAGLVRYYQDRTGDAPLLGLWKETMWYDLHWKPEGSGRRPRLPSPWRLPKFPSWSWLSSKIRLYNDYEGWDGINTLRVIECGVKWTGQPFTSELVSSRLLVSNLVKVPPADMIYNDPSEHGYPDLDYEMSEEEMRGILFLLLHAYEGMDGKVMENYLIILPVAGNSLVYRRVGRGWTHGERKKDGLCFFHSAEEMVIELV
jgi:Heterokaryon incompatibility protein (HET)